MNGRFSLTDGSRISGFLKNTGEMNRLGKIENLRAVSLPGETRVNEVFIKVCGSDSSKEEKTDGERQMIFLPPFGKFHPKKDGFRRKIFFNESRPFL